MTLLILQMLGLLVLAALLGWLIGRWKVTTLLTERDELHEMQMRSRFKKIEELKQSLNASHSEQSGVDLEVHRMLEDRFHQLKQDHTKAQQLLQDSERKLSKTKNELQQREQDLHEADQSLAKRDLELTTLQEKDRQAQTLLSRVDQNAAGEVTTLRDQLSQARERLELAEQEREAAQARSQELDGQVAELRERSQSEQARLRDSVEQTRRNANLISELQAELEQVKEGARAAEQESAEKIVHLRAQDTTAALDAAVADAARWRKAHDVAVEKATRTEALLAEADQRAADNELRNRELERMNGELQGLQVESNQAQSQAEAAKTKAAIAQSEAAAAQTEAATAQSEAAMAQAEAAALRDEIALLGAAKEKSERSADVLKQVYFRMRDRFREAEAQAQHLTAVSREQAVSVADDSATTARLLREKRELEERLEKNEAVTGKLRGEFNKHFVLSARLQEALKGQQEQLSGAQLAIDRYEKAEAEAREARRNMQNVEQEHVQSSSAADEMISVLKSTVSRQRNRLALARDGIDELQQLLNADLSHSERIRRRRQPASLSKVAANSPDNLQRIKGIGWRKEARLRSLGIDRYSDLARLSAEDVLWLDQVMGLDGAVLRQDWVGQSRKLAVVASRGARKTSAGGASAGIDRPIKRVAEPRRANPKKSSR